MSVEYRTLYSLDTILSTKHNTFTVSGEVDGFMEKVNLLYIKGIDLKKKQITLGVLFPVESFTIDQCKQLVCTHKVVMLQKDPEKKIIFTVSQIYQEKFPTATFKLVLQTGFKEETLCSPDKLQYLDADKYKVVAKNFMPFAQFVAKKAAELATKK